jgi:hypothetical protein
MVPQKRTMPFDLFHLSYRVGQLLQSDSSEPHVVGGAGAWGSDLKLRITIDLVSVDYRGSGKRQKSASEMTFHGIFLFLEYSCQCRSWLPNLTRLH